MLTEYHCHALPGIDDGSDSVETSLAMLEMMKEQGVERVVFTPHFYCHREKSVERFLEKRQAAFESIKDKSPIKDMRLGAEVAIEHGISEVENIEKLAIQGTKLILMEFPYREYNGWMSEEIYNVSAEYDLKIMIAHVHRYLPYYSKEELENTIVNTRRLMVVCTVTFGFVLVALFLMGQVLGLNVIYGYMVAVLLAAVCVTVLYSKNNSAQLELKTTNNTISRLIQLQNTVKIRYVNNKNLLDYMCLKYGVNDSDELDDLHDRFLQEREQREQFKATEKSLDSSQKQLMQLLRRLRINDPEIWIHQLSAIFKPEDAEKIRRDLVVQRQSLRKRMDYNRDVVAGGAKAEIELLAKEYPEYTNEILDMVSRYEEKYPMS